MSLTTKTFCLFVIITCIYCEHHNIKPKHITKSQDYLQSTARNGRKPNIVLFLTDDQDVELGSLNFMPKTLKSIREHGAEFRHAYVTTPMCCPSRSSLLTGMYVHNHQVFTNNDNCSSAQWQATHEKQSFATYLSNAGYRTGYFGKYLNKYNGTYIPPGWREWGGLIMNSKYYNYSINMNGKKIKHGFSYSKDYYTDLIANDSITFLRNSKKQFPNKPLMLTMAFPAPHGPEDSAPQYSNLFFNISTHHTPSYDYAPNPDKQWILQITNKMQPVHRQFTDLLMTKRLQTLQSVDVAVEQVINELKNLGELENTYVIYTSDHGYHLGQFGLIKGKSFPFEFDVRVPFLIRGPGIIAGSTLNEIVLNIDLAPTFLDMAGVEPPSNMDGHSILPLFSNPRKKKKIKWPDTFLIESSGRRETPHLDNKHQQSNLLQYSIPSDILFPTGDSSEHISDQNKTIEYVNKTEGQGNDDDVNSFKIEDYDFNDTATNTPDSQKQDNQWKNIINTLPLKTHKCPLDFKSICRGGIKRNCHIDKYRWRRNKCRDPNVIIPIRRNDKKCICFTSNGLIYKSSSELYRIGNGLNHTTTKKIRSDQQSVHASHQKPQRRKIRYILKRDKRDSVVNAEINGDFNQIQDVMETGKNVNISNNTQSAETNEIARILPECTISNGKVNCSNTLYQNKRAWKNSRYQIEGEIFSLKQKLENLKEIKKYLKTTKPKWKNIDEYTIDVLMKKTVDQTYKESPPYPKHKQNINLKNQQIKENTKEENSHEHPEASKNPHRHHHHNPNEKTNFSDIKSKYNRVDAFKRSINEEELSFNFTSNIPKKQKLRQNYCYCEDENGSDVIKSDEEAIAPTNEDKRKIKKQKKKEEECHFERMTCFEHNNDHWRTQPKWDAGPFCFCMNANNNTFSCLRTINNTHNFLYCEFTTGLITFYNLRIDPFELQNRFYLLKTSEKSYLKNLLRKMVACRGGSCSQQIELNNIHF